MEILPDVGPPDWGLAHNSEFKVQETQFGDGYEQAMPDGLNSVRRTWSVSWTGLDKRPADTLYGFLVERKGAYSFLWPLPDTKRMVQVRCRKAPTLTVDDWGSYTVKAEFREVFTP